MAVNGEGPFGTIVRPDLNHGVSLLGFRFEPRIARPPNPRNTTRRLGDLFLCLRRSLVNRFLLIGELLDKFMYPNDPSSVFCHPNLSWFGLLTSATGSGDDHDLANSLQERFINWLCLLL